MDHWIEWNGPLDKIIHFPCGIEWNGPLDKIIHFVCGIEWTIGRSMNAGLQKNVLVTCCGAGGPYNFNPGMWCGVGSAVPCVNPGQYLNWDGVHLTDSAYGNIAKLFLDGTFTTPPLQYSVCKMPAAKPTRNVNATLN